jgi:hypothetical protein
MQTSITSDSLTEHPGVGSAPSPEVDTVQDYLEDAMKKRLETDFISDRAQHERSNPIALNTPIQWHEIVGICDACGRHFMQKLGLADAIPGCRFDSARDEPGVLNSPQERRIA